jgi:hypothetical protein
MSLTFLSARYANTPEEREAGLGSALAVTAESGEVLISQPDQPEEWARLHDELDEIAPFVMQPPPAPAEVTRPQALIALRRAGITRQALEAAIAGIADEDEREEALIRYEGQTWRRDSAFIAWGKAQFGLSDEQVDALFRAAATL